MIKKGMMAVCGLMLAMTVNAQNAYDAERVLGNDLNGTARFVGMGGAMSALGGDISVISSNPAGIGIFRSNDVSLSFGFNNTGTESMFNGTSMKEDKTRASLDQIGFVYTYKIGNTTSLRYVNFGFNYHKSKNFNRLFSMGGQLDGLSQSWQLAQEMTASVPCVLTISRSSSKATASGGTEKEDFPQSLPENRKFFNFFCHFFITRS